MRSVALGLSAVFLCGCGTGGDVGGPEHVPVFVSVALPPEPQLDILVVMDNSPAMLLDAVAQLGTVLPALFTALAGTGALPDLHLGVVTSDLSTLGVDTGDPACSSSDRGHLQNLNCPDVTGAYVADISDGLGGRLINYSGSLQAAASCLMTVGVGGCGFEQHLEAMRVAIEATDGFNTGFFRQTAQLAILVFADEDDCSARDPVVFGPDSPALGPLDSFRCFEYGVACAEGDARPEGPRTGCAPRDGSYLHTMPRYLDFVNAARPGRVSVHGLFGDPSPVEVGRRTPMGQTTPRPVLMPSCTRSDAGLVGLAAPGVRLDAFVRGMGDFGSSTSVCQADYAPAMTALGTRLRDRLVGQPCLRAVPWDSDPDVDGTQVACEVVLTSIDAAPTPLDACDGAATNPPCWRLVADPACGAAPADLRLDGFGLPSVLGRHVQARCEVVP